MPDIAQMLEWVHGYYGQDLRDEFANRLTDQPELEPHVVLDRLLQERLGGPVPDHIDQLIFCSD